MKEMLEDLERTQTAIKLLILEGSGFQSSEELAQSVCNGGILYIYMIYITKWEISAIWLAQRSGVSA